MVLWIPVGCLVFMAGLMLAFGGEKDETVEVVRCKDCKWWKLSEYNTCGIHICQRFSGVRGEHDFCSRGERRENGTENN